MDVSDLVALVGFAGVLFVGTVFFWFDTIRRQWHITRHREQAEDFYNDAYTHYRKTTALLARWADKKVEEIDQWVS